MASGSDLANVVGVHKLTNGEVEVVVSTEFGPRVLELRRAGGENVFGDLSDEPPKPTPFGDGWRIRGGHRLWLAPEDPVITYYPDNASLTSRGDARAVTVTQPVEPHTHIEKEMTLELLGGTRVRVTHRMRNRGALAIDVTLWALSVLRTGGVALLPQPPYAPFPDALLPARPIVTWQYVKMSDERFGWGDRFIRVRQDPNAKTPQKIGAFDVVGTVGYASRGELFVKRHAPMRGAHVDFGCNVEIFVNDRFLELETLSPTQRIGPNETAEHVEEWTLLPIASETDEEIAAAFAHVART
jgi:hypothetical protein